MIFAKMKIALAFLKRVPWQVWAALAIVLTAWLWGNYRYSEGVSDENARHAEIQRKAEEQSRANARKAEENDAETRSEGEGEIAERRKELDNDKANLPDQSLTARQRARACAELRRAGEECPPASPAR